MSERVWLKHPETGGLQHFDSEAVPNWIERGWVLTEEPEPVNQLWGGAPPPGSVPTGPEAPAVTDETGTAKSNVDTAAPTEVDKSSKPIVVRPSAGNTAGEAQS